MKLIFGLISALLITALFFAWHVRAQQINCDQLVLPVDPNGAAHCLQLDQNPNIALPTVDFTQPSPPAALPGGVDQDGIVHFLQLDARSKVYAHLDDDELAAIRQIVHDEIEAHSNGKSHTLCEKGCDSPTK